MVGWGGALAPLIRQPLLGSSEHLKPEIPAKSVPGFRYEAHNTHSSHQDGQKGHKYRVWEQHVQQILGMPMIV